MEGGWTACGGEEREQGWRHSWWGQKLPLWQRSSPSVILDFGWVRLRRASRRRGDEETTTEDLCELADKQWSRSQ